MNDIKEIILKVYDENIALKEENEQLKHELSLLCPIADLPVIDSLKTEKLMLMEQIEELVKEKQLLYGRLNMIRDLLDKEV